MANDKKDRAAHQDSAAKVAVREDGRGFKCHHREREVCYHAGDLDRPTLSPCLNLNAAAKF